MRMRHGLAIWIAISAVCLVPATAAAEKNIYAGDVEQAQERLEGARARYNSAATDSAQVKAKLPAVAARTQRQRPVAKRRQRAAVLAVTRASTAEAAEMRRRAAAAGELRAARAAHREQLAHWRAELARWIAIAALLVATALAFALTGAVASSRATLTGRDGERGRERAANRAALALGSTVTLYLSGLLAALYWADAWRFSWWALGAAVVGAITVCASVGVAWTRSELLAARVRRLRRTALVRVAVAALAAIAPAVVAAADARPIAPRLPAAVLTLAEQASADAPMPEGTRKLRRIADGMVGRASNAEGRYRDAADEERRLLELKADAAARLERARRSIDERAHDLRRAQRNFDDYEALLDPDYSDEDLDSPVDDENIPDHDPPVLDDPPRTTEDFGNGSGSIGQCRDGTWSDSVGRPGACSHHGGVG